MYIHVVVLVQKQGLTHSMNIQLHTLLNELVQKVLYIILLALETLFTVVAPIASSMVVRPISI